MAVAYHTHVFDIPVASNSEVAAGSISDKVVVPSSLGLGSVVQAYDAGLASIAGLTTSADLMIYTTGVDAYATTALTPFARTLLDDANAAAARTTIGVSIGSDVQAYDAGLASIAGLTTAADRMLYTTGSDVYATTVLTSFARTLLDDADASTALSTLGVSTFMKTVLDDADAPTARATLGLTIGTNVQAYDAGLQSIAGLTTASDQMIYTTALDTYATASLTPFARTILDDANAAAAQATLGLDAVYLRITSDPLKEFLRLGMVPNDLGSAASNATLLNTALGEIPATGGGLLANFGNFYVADINALPTNRPLSIRGQAKGASIITPTQTTGTFLEFSQTDYTDTVDFRDFTLQFETAALCRAMSITYPAADATNNQMPHRVTGRNVDIRGLNAALHGPKSGIDLINVTGADFARVHINGRQDTSLSGENQFFSMEYAWKSTAPSAGTPTIQKWNQCKVFACINAWDVADLHEGLHWQDCEAVAVGRGIRVNLTADRPGFYIGKTHIAAFRECIVLNGGAQAEVVNNHLYIREDATVTPGRCVYLVNGDGSVVAGNIMINLSNPLASGVNGIGVELSNTNGNQVVDNDMGALMQGCLISGTSANNTYRRGKWHDAVGTGTISEYIVTGSGTGNIRRGQELSASSRNSAGSVNVTGGSAVNVASVSTDTLEVGDDIEVFFSMQCDKDANAGHVRAIVAKTGTSTILFDDNKTQLDIEVYCAASQVARLRGSAKGTVTVRGTCTLELQGFAPANAFTVPTNGGQIQVVRR